MGGLVHESSSGEFSIHDAYQTGAASTTSPTGSPPAPGVEATGGQPSGGGVDTSTNVSDVGATTINSHLDSFFDASGFTREDVLVLAGAAQICLWLALLYLEVRQL